MNIIRYTNDDTIEYNWNQNAKNYICDIFNMTRDSFEKNTILPKLQTVYDYDEGITLVALMFYMRNIRKSSGPHNHGKGKGEKLISYTILLWLLENHEKIFIVNYITFIQMGYYKDCLILASIAKQQTIPEYKIILLLTPMAIALSNDDENLYIAQLSGNYSNITMSRAAKWAPRQGKAYSHCIPYLKQLCGITGAKSNMKWRKYIQRLTIASKSPKTIETLLSSKQYENINFNFIPIKAFNLYKNKFKRTGELSTKYHNYLRDIMFYKNINDTSISEFELDKITPYDTVFNTVSKYIPLVNGLPTTY
jgi:hypothetical protein